MFSRIRKHLTPSTAIAFAALIFALTGGAYAATGGGASHATLTASAAKAKKKSAPAGKPGPRGPAGPAGAAGAAGPAGPVGPAGPAGAKGETGAAGTGTTGAEGKKGKEGKGTPGAPGASVTATEFTGSKPGSKCTEGGSEFKIGTAATFACNGEAGNNGTNGTNGATGATGPEGSPWVDGGTLPSGSSEKGQWAGGGPPYPTAFGNLVLVRSRSRSR